jgi:hypothetical protein
MADDQPAGCGAKSSQFGGAVVPVRDPEPGGLPCSGVVKGAAPGSGVGGGGGGGGARIAVQPLLPLFRAESASVTPGRMPGVTDQDLCQLEAWLGNRRHLAGVMRNVITGLPPQAHCHGHGRGEHLARPRRGARGCIVLRLP